jgi:predicted membrane metal-binding protein
VIWHFGRWPWAGLPANLVFTPLLSFLVLIPGLLALAALSVLKLR